MGFFGGFAGGFGSELTHQVDQNRKTEAERQEAILESQSAPIVARLKDPGLSPDERNTLNTKLLQMYGPQNGHKAMAKLNEAYGISTAPAPKVSIPTPSAPIAIPGAMGSTPPPVETGAGPTISRPARTVDEILASAPKSAPKPLTGAKPYKDADTGKFFISGQDPTTGRVVPIAMPDNYTEKSHAQTLKDEYKTLTGKDLDASEDEAKMAIGLKPKTGGKRTAEEEKLDTYAQSLGLKDRSEMTFDQLKAGISEISKPKFKQTAEEVNKSIFARTIGKPVDQWTAKDLTRYENMQGIAKNPIGVQNANTQSQRNKLMERSIDNAQSRSDLAGYLQTKKSLVPQQTAIDNGEKANNWVKEATGPGDLALTMAYFHAIQTQGTRFSKQENDLIAGSKGFVDTIEATMQKAKKGTIFSNDQRKLINDVIQAGAKHAQDQMDEQLNAVSELAPRVGNVVNPKKSAAALKESAPRSSKNGGAAAPAKTKGKHSLKQAMALPVNKGKTEAQVRADLQKWGYEVIP